MTLNSFNAFTVSIKAFCGSILCIILECSRKGNKKGKYNSHPLPGMQHIFYIADQKQAHTSHIFLVVLFAGSCVIFQKQTLRSRLYPGNSLIDGDSILVELPCVCSAPYFVKAGFISLLSPDDT